MVKQRMVINGGACPIYLYRLSFKVLGSALPCGPGKCVSDGVAIYVSSLSKRNALLSWAAIRMPLFLFTLCWAV